MSLIKKKYGSVVKEGHCKPGNSPNELICEVYKKQNDKHGVTEGPAQKVSTYRITIDENGNVVSKQEAAVQGKTIQEVGKNDEFVDYALLKYSGNELKEIARR